MRQIRVAVDFEQEIIQLLQSHVCVFAVSGYRVAPKILRQILGNVDIVKVILSGDIGGIFGDIVYRHGGHGRIQNAALRQLVDRGAERFLQRGRD